MKRLFLSFLFFALSSMPCHALESQFLEDMSGVLSIKAGSATTNADGIVLANCSVTLQGVGQGSIGSLQIVNESPGKVGQIIADDVRLPGMAVQRAVFENMSGNFAALAPAMPILFHLQGYVMANPVELLQELGVLKALLPALKKFHIDKLTMTGFRTKEEGQEFELKSVTYKNLNFAYLGSGAIQDMRIKSKGQLIATVTEMNWGSVEFRNIEAMLSLDPRQLDMEDLKPSSFQDLFNLTIKDFLIRNVRVPMIGLSLEEGKLNIDSQPGALNGGAAFKNLRLPGLLLAMAGLENPPEVISFDGSLRFKAAYDDDSYAAIQKFSFSAGDLFALSGRGGIEGSVKSKDDDFTLTDVNLTFQNRGILGCLSSETKHLIRQWIRTQMPALNQITERLFSGNADSLILSFENSDKLEDLKIDVK